MTFVAGIGLSCLIYLAVVMLTGGFHD